MRAHTPVNMKKGTVAVVSATPEAERFFLELISFYEKSIMGMVEGVKQVSKLQKEFTTEYELFKKLQREPDLISKLAEKLND